MCRLRRTTLLRLDDAGKELTEPARFMHVLDDLQLARPIGLYVLDEALKRCQSWMREGISIPVSINISTRHLLHPAFFTDIDAALEMYPGVMDVGFGIEVTETSSSMDHSRAKVVIEECRRRGIRVGLDDFGTGSASLSHIQQLDIGHIKLDQSFVRDILSDERKMAIAAGVITTTRMLAKTVIVEGVETSAQIGARRPAGFAGMSSTAGVLDLTPDARRRGAGLGRRMGAFLVMGNARQRAPVPPGRTARPRMRMPPEWCRCGTTPKISANDRALRAFGRSSA